MSLDSDSFETLKQEEGDDIVSGLIYDIKVLSLRHSRSLRHARRFASLGDFAGFKYAVASRHSFI